MKLEKASIKLLVGRDGTTIEIRDEKSGAMFCELQLTNDQLASALSRMGHTPCEASVYGLDKLNKQQEVDTFEFEAFKGARSSDADTLVEMAKSALYSADMSEWKPDSYFSSQNSFFEKDGKRFARVTIRRWI